MMKPRVSKRSSPYEAMATPSEIMQTMAKSFLFGSWMRAVQEMRRIATGTNACQTGLARAQRRESGGRLALSIWMKGTERWR